MIPYLAVLILALIGLNVFMVLTSGIVLAAVVGLLTASIDLPGIAQAVYAGITGMDDVFYLTLLMSGLSAIVTKNGGIDWLIDRFRAIMKDNKSAQVGIAALTCACDVAVANKTVAIIVAGGVCNDISKEYKVDPRRTASLLDVFACMIQGVLPYSAQPLVAAALATAAVEGVNVTAVGLLPHLWYCWFLAIFGILSIFVPFADGICRKNPWNWEYDCAESKVNEKKAQIGAAGERS